jgi:hypothetical protein
MVQFTDPEVAGYLPQIFLEDDPRSCREQAQERYAHGGGWMPFEGFALDYQGGPHSATITYPGDPAFFVRSVGKCHDETILLFDYGWVVILQTDGTFEVSRMD